MNKAFFCDRDGIVNHRIIGDYVKKIDEFIFIDVFFSIFRYAVSNNYLPILITNQQGIGKKLMTENDLSLIHQYMNKVLSEHTSHTFHDIFYCGELADSEFSRRKPSPAMIHEAAEKYNLDLSKSFMLGDNISDIDAGKNAGCKTILISERFYSQADFHFSSHKDFIKAIQSTLK